MTPLTYEACNDVVFDITLWAGSVVPLVGLRPGEGVDALCPWVDVMLGPYACSSWVTFIVRLA